MKSIVVGLLINASEALQLHDLVLPRVEGQNTNELSLAASQNQVSQEDLLGEAEYQLQRGLSIVEVDQ